MLRAGSIRGYGIHVRFRSVPLVVGEVVMGVRFVQGPHEPISRYFGDDACCVRVYVCIYA